MDDGTFCQQQHDTFYHSHHGKRCHERLNVKFCYYQAVCYAHQRTHQHTNNDGGHSAVPAGDKCHSGQHAGQ